MAFLRSPANRLYYEIYCNNYDSACAELEQLSKHSPAAINVKEIVGRCLLYWHLDDTLLLLHSYNLPFEVSNYVIAALYEQNEYDKIKFVQTMVRYDEAEFLADIVRGGNARLLQQLVPEYRPSFRLHTGEYLPFSRLLEIAEECGGEVWEHLAAIDEEQLESEPEPLGEEELLYGENEVLDSEEEANEPYYWWW